MVTTGSSVKQELRDKSVSVVITDPPYFDDVQYGELARLFHTWLRIYDPTVVVDESGEAVPNAGRGVSADDYERTIAACLAESRRTLKADGRLVLTFHNKKLAAWRALAGAIGKAGFEVSSLAAVLAENHADHCKRNVNAMLHDLVIECVIAKAGAPVTPRGRRNDRPQRRRPIDVELVVHRGIGDQLDGVPVRSTNGQRRPKWGRMRCHRPGRPKAERFQKPNPLFVIERTRPASIEPVLRCAFEIYFMRIAAACATPSSERRRMTALVS